MVHKVNYNKKENLMGVLNKDFIGYKESILLNGLEDV